MNTKKIVRQAMLMHLKKFHQHLCPLTCIEKKNVSLSLLHIGTLCHRMLLFIAVYCGKGKLNWLVNWKHGNPSYGSVWTFAASLLLSRTQRLT